jgi:hypothetical protein
MPAFNRVSRRLSIASWECCNAPSDLIAGQKKLWYIQSNGRIKKTISLKEACRNRVPELVLPFAGTFFAKDG